MQKNENSLDIVSVRLVRDRSIMAEDPIDSAEDAIRIVGRYFRDFDREVIGLLCMDTRSKPVNMSVLSMGSVDSCFIHPRELFKPAILSNASFLIVLHNHPSGDPHPSPADIQMTDRVNKLAAMMGMPLLDHIIVGGSITGENYYSFAQNDYFKESPTIEYAEKVEDINFGTEYHEEKGFAL